MNDDYKGLTFVASYSGGKDCVLAIHRAIKHGMKLQALLITYNVKKERSWFHGIPKSVLKKVSDSIGAPVRLIETDGSDYNEKFEAALTEEKNRGADVCVFGDIDIDDHLKWGEERCAHTGLKACFPLWHENRRMIVEEEIKSGFHITLTVVDTRRLDISFAGKVLTLDLLREMEEAGIDCCGENGEYHSFVSDGPVFSVPVEVGFEEPLLLSDYAVVPIVG